MSSEPQKNLNDFNAWDCFGATLMLAMVPAIMNYVFTPEHDVSSTIFIAIIAVLISLVVLGLALITRWRIIGVLVNFAGTILAHVYVVIAICAWWPDDKTEEPESSETPQKQVVQPVAQP